MLHELLFIYKRLKGQASYDEVRDLHMRGDEARGVSVSHGVVQGEQPPKDRPYERPRGVRRADL